MTSTNIFTGFNDKRNSSKVLKPPGGGSSDIFGVTANGGPMPTDNSSSSAASTPRAKNHMVSNIFSAPLPTEHRNGGGDSGRRNGNGATRANVQIGNSATDSHNRLFGDVNRSNTPAKNHQKSNIPFGSNSSNGNGVNGNNHSVVDSSSSVATTNGKTNGNSVNGNGYHTNGNGAGASAADSISMNGNGTKIEQEQMTPSIRSNGSTPRRHESPIFEHNAQTSLLCPLTNKSNDSSNTATTADSSSTSSSTNSSASSLLTNTGSLNSGGGGSGGDGGRSPRFNINNLSRNPVTGSGVDQPFHRPRKMDFHRDGNPVTGEGYKPAEINTTVPALNGTKQVINKNRIPPGGFSSGLW